MIRHADLGTQFLALTQRLPGLAHVAQSVPCPQGCPLQALVGDCGVQAALCPGWDEDELDAVKFMGFSPGHTARWALGQVSSVEGIPAWACQGLIHAPINKHVMSALWQVGAMLETLQQMRLLCLCPYPAYNWWQRRPHIVSKFFHFYLHESRTRKTAFKYIPSLIRKCTILLYL